MSSKHSPFRRARRSAPRGRRPPRLRRIVPGCTYLITKKTNDDLFWLRPSKESDGILSYTLLLKCRKYGLLLHAFQFMSNHFHLVVTDVRGELPSHMREFLSESSKAIQVQLNSDRRVWSSERYSSTELLDLDAAERKIVNALLNPTAAELTEPAEWPGLTSARLEFGETIRAVRPEVYFSRRYRPAEVSLTISPLPEHYFEDLCGQPLEGESGRGSHESSATTPRPAPEALRRVREASAARIRTLLTRETERIRGELARCGRSLAGVHRVLHTSRTTRGTHPLRGLNPRFATRDPALLEQAIARSRKFESDHVAAKERYIAGRTRTLFPHGTYGYRKVLGVRVKKEESAA